MERRKAYHRLVLPSGEVIPHPIVIYDEEGNILSWHPMTHEEPFTEWVGGEVAVGS